MRCEKCGYANPAVIIHLTDGAKTIHICPNCMARMLMNNQLSFINNPNFIDDITGKPGAVKFESYGEAYCVERRTMMRLLSYNLHKSEWQALSQKYGAHNFMLHDDFYLPDGTAIQPIK